MARRSKITPEKVRTYLDPQIVEGENASPGKGWIPAEYAIVGMAPSPNRPGWRFNQPFGASAYATVERILDRAPKQSLYITNLVKTPQPFNKKLKVGEIRYWYPVLEKELMLVKPRRILAVGAQPAQILCPGFEKLRADHGTMFYNPTFDAIVVPTFHFSAVKRTPQWAPMLIRDLERFFGLPDPEEPPYTILKSWKGLDKHMTKECDLYLDLETTSLDPLDGEITKIGLAVDDGGCLIFEDPTKKDLLSLHSLMEKYDPTIIGHNLTFDFAFLQENSQKPWRYENRDTMIMAHQLGELVLSLKHLTVMNTDRPGPHAFGGPEDNPYLTEDILSTRELDEIYEPKTRTYARDLIADMTPVAVQMRLDGVYLDREKMSKLKDTREWEVAEAAKALDEKAGYRLNWNAPAQVVQFLLEQKVKLTDRTASGKNYSVAEAIMIKHSSKYPVCQEILEYREIEKEYEFLCSYMESTTQEHRFLHPHLMLGSTRTGRLSCQDPNLQQVKRTGPIKTYFIPRWVDALYGLLDLSQAELRVAALLSDDEEFAEMLLEEEPHRALASRYYQTPAEEISAFQRKKSKGITFGLLYGGSPKGLAGKIGAPVEEVEKVLENIFRSFPKLMRFIKSMRVGAVKAGEVWTPFGRRRDLQIISKLEGNNAAGRVAINTPIQSTASDITLAIINYTIREFWIREMASMGLFGVHDSGLFELMEDEVEEAAEIMNQGFQELNNSPLADFPLWGTIPIIGELVTGISWAAVESTNEENYDPIEIYTCSSEE